jgi:hypothetical protein
MMRVTQDSFIFRSHEYECVIIVSIVIIVPVGSHPVQKGILILMSFLIRCAQNNGNSLP